MQRVPLCTVVGRGVRWTACALLLFTPWLLHRALTQTPLDEAPPVNVRLAFSSEETAGAQPAPRPLNDDEHVDFDHGALNAIEPAVNSAALSPRDDARMPQVKLSFKPVVPVSRHEPPPPTELPPPSGPPARPAAPTAQSLYFVKGPEGVAPHEVEPSRVAPSVIVPPTATARAPVEASQIIPTLPPPAAQPVALPPAAPTTVMMPAAAVTTAALPQSVAMPPAVVAPLPEQSQVVQAGASPADVATEPAGVQLFFAEGLADGTPAALVDPTIVPVACSSCGGGTGGGVLNPYYSGNSMGAGMPFNGYTGCKGCGGGGGGGCLPYRSKCSPCLADTRAGRFLCCVYNCICCPDPCYDPRWIPIADASFFTDAPRPQTQTRFRWDTGNNLLFPDRNTYFWPQSNGVNAGVPGTGPLPKTPLRGEKRVDYFELSMYTEVATGLIGFFFEMPYRSLYPEIANSAAGFSDINLGTKSLLYDCELFQLTFMFRTYILSGNFTKGLGTGHITIEPTLILGTRLGPETYSVLEVGEWIPFAPPTYGGTILRANYSLNQVIYRILPDVPLIGTMEMQTWSFQGGNYTDPVLGTVRSTGETYVNVGPGLRLFVCDKLDFGVGTSFALTQAHWAQQLIRAEFRLRF